MEFAYQNVIAILLYFYKSMNSNGDVKLLKLKQQIWKMKTLDGLYGNVSRNRLLTVMRNGYFCNSSNAETELWFLLLTGDFHAISVIGI